MRKKKHSRAEMAAKLMQANDLATQGKIQSEIARALGVSVMTLHRWRKSSAKGRPPAPVVDAAIQSEPEFSHDNRIAELQLENSRLRRLVTDLLLEKMKLEEVAQTAKLSREAGRRASR